MNTKLNSNLFTIYITRT